MHRYEIETGYSTHGIRLAPRTLDICAKREILPSDQVEPCLVIKSTARLENALSLETQAFEQAGVGMAYLKGERLIRVNQTFSELAGFSVEELEGGWLFNLTHPKDRVARMAHFAAMLAENKTVVTFDERYHRKDGSIAWATITIKKIISDEADHLVVAQDVTAKVVAERQVREERDKLKRALASMTDAVYLCDTEGNLVEYNAAFAAACSNPNDTADLLDNPSRYADYFDLSHINGALLARGEWPVYRALSGEVVTDQILSIRRKDTGDSRVASFNCSPVYQADGAISGCVVVVRDVTRRRRAEAALQTERDKLKAALFSTPDAVFIGDAAGNVVEFNDALVSFLRYSTREDLSRSLDEHAKVFELATYDGQRLAPSEWQISRALRGESGNNELVKFLRKDTNEWWYASCNFAPIHGTNGLVSGCVVVQRDITEAKLAEDALLASRDELERMVDERTQRLAEAKREADRANDAKTRFLAAASHDLRQPLQAAMAYLGAFKRTAPNSVSASITAGLTKSLAVMDGLLGTMLDMSRLQSGVIQPRPTLFSLSDLLEEVAKAVLPAARNKGIAVLTTLEPCHVETDRALLLSVVHNLLSNAVKYTERGFVAVRTRVANGTATVEIEDSGIGISEADQAKIFVEYVQLANPSRDPNLGVGLGLSLVKTSLDLLDIPLRVHSVVGQGSQFSFDLACETAPEATASVGFAIGSTAKVSLRILLVEDDTAVRESFEILLATFGYHVISAATGEAALAHLSNGHAFDVLLTDYRLPDMHGTDVIRAARDIINAPVAAILVTGDTMLDDIRAQAIPDCQVMSKPVNISVLMEVLKKLRPLPGSMAPGSVA